MNKNSSVQDALLVLEQHNDSTLLFFIDYGCVIGIFFFRSMSRNKIQTLFPRVKRRVKFVGWRVLWWPSG